MSSQAEAFRDLGTQYTEFLAQFTQFAEAIAKFIDANPIPSFAITSADDVAFCFSYLGRDYEATFECFARNDLASPQRRIDPYIRFRRQDQTRTLSLDKHGNVTSAESGNNIGNIQKEPTDVFFIVLGSLARDSG